MIPSVEHIACAMYDVENGYAVLDVNSPDSFLAPFGTQFVAGTMDQTVHCIAEFAAQ